MPPDNALLDSHREAAPLVYLALQLEEDPDASEEVRALFAPVLQAPERAERALAEALRYLDSAGTRSAGLTRKQDFPCG